MTNLAIAVPSEDRLGANGEEPLFSVPIRPAPASGQSADTHTPDQPARFPECAPEYLAFHPQGCQDVVLPRRSPQETAHLGGAVLDTPDAHTFMPEVWQHLIQQYAIESVLDVGAGAGWSTKWFVEKGLYTLGIEGWKKAIEKGQCHSNVVEHDYTEGSFVPACRFDLAWCAEFVQHVEERFIPNFMASFQSCKYVCLTHAEPGQPGFHHVNCQPTEYWIKKLKEYGFDYDPQETFQLRSIDPRNDSRGRKTLTFFVRNDDAR